MKISDPIRASVQVCPIISHGRSVQRHKVFSLPIKAILSGLGFLFLFGFSGHANGLQAQPFNVDRGAPKTINEGPKVINAAKPAYPPIAAARRISGKVVVGVDIDVNGMVTEAHAQSGHPILLTAARSAALRWRFNSTREDVGIRSAKLIFNFLKISSPDQEDGFSAPYQMVVRWEGAAEKRADPLPTDGSSSNNRPNKSPLAKRIVLTPVRLGRSVISALFPRSGETIQNASYAKLTHAEPPTYPAIARAAHITGKVEVQVTIKSGSVIKAEVKSSKSPFLTNPTIANIKTWQFNPDASATFRVTYSYRIEGNETLLPESPRLELDLPRSAKITAKPFKPTCSDCPWIADPAQTNQSKFSASAEIPSIPLRSSRNNLFVPQNEEETKSPAEGYKTVELDRHQDLKDSVRKAIDLPFPKDANESREQLLRFGPPATPLIAEAIRSDSKMNPIKKAFLVDVIGRITGEESDSTLISLLSDNEPHVRGLAATYLGKRRVRAAIPNLINLLNDQDVYITITYTDPASEHPVLVRDVAIESLQAVTGTVLAPQGSKEQQAQEWVRWNSTTQTELTGRFVAFDKFQGLTNPREPIQRFVVEVQKGGLFAAGQSLKVVYFAETTSMRGGAKFLGDQTLSYANTWTMKIHQPSTEKERLACRKVDNFLRAPDGSVDEDERGKPILRFRSTRLLGDITFDDLSVMPCLILDSLTH